MNFFDRYFSLRAEGYLIGSIPVFIAFINLIGNQVDASNFRYSLEIRENGQKLSFEGIPRCINSESRNKMDGLIVMGSMVHSGGETWDINLDFIGGIWNPGLGCCAVGFWAPFLCGVKA